MTKLIYSSETIGCGATFILESNEYCSISVARSGVLVRSHQAHFFARVFGGFFGPILYNERNVYMAENVAMWLNSLFPERNPSLIFRNPLLTAFAHAVWHCSSAAEVSIVLNEANKEVALATEQPSGHQATRPSREDILGDYAAFMEHNTSHPTTIEDVSVLPHSKEIILDALLVEIGRGHSKHFEDNLRFALISLAQYQPGVGNEPLKMPSLRAIADVAEANMWGRFLKFDKLVDEDLRRILSKIDVTVDELEAWGVIRPWGALAEKFKQGSKK